MSQSRWRWFLLSLSSILLRQARHDQKKSLLSLLWRGVESLSGPKVHDRVCIRKALSDAFRFARENVKSYTSETASQSIPVSNQPKETKTVEGLALTEDLEVGRSEECGGSCV